MAGPILDVSVLFHEDLADAGAVTDWRIVDDLGITHVPDVVAPVFDEAKCRFDAWSPLRSAVSITLNNVGSTAQNVLLQPLFTGNDFPVAP